MADKRPIGIFDSGLGGLTVVKEIRRVLPNESIVYFGDTGRVPYGGRSSQTISRYAVEDEQLLLRHDVKLIVAACGTVSSVASHTAENLPVPFFEVVTAAAYEAALKSVSGRIGVIGTGATIKSSAHKKFILSIRPEAEVVERACPLFVPLVEEAWIDRNDPVVRATVERYLMPVKDAGVDTLILGCTHYPILKDVIADVMGNSVRLINPGITTAVKIKEYLDNNDLAAPVGTEPAIEYLVSDKTASFSAVASVLLGCSLDDNSVRLVNIKDE